MSAQKALKEKEEHVEQLLQERDLERSEVARAAAQVDKVGCKTERRSSFESIVVMSIVAVKRMQSMRKRVW